MLIFATLLIILLVISNVLLFRKANNKNFDGDIIVSRQQDGPTLYSLELNKNPETYGKKVLVFRVLRDAQDDSE